MLFKSVKSAFKNITINSQYTHIVIIIIVIIALQTGIVHSNKLRLYSFCCCYGKHPHTHTHKPTAFQRISCVLLLLCTANIFLKNIIVFHQFFFCSFKLNAIKKKEITFIGIFNGANTHLNPHCTEKSTNLQINHPAIPHAKGSY